MRLGEGARLLPYVDRTLIKTEYYLSRCERPAYKISFQPGLASAALAFYVRTYGALRTEFSGACKS